jgi:vacuolar protein sorting-associated protein 33A
MASSSSSSSAAAGSAQVPASSSDGGGGEASAKASGTPLLSNAAIDLRVFREHARKELVDVLDSIRGPKALVLDPKLSGPLGLVAEVGLLREHYVEKIYHLLPGRLDTECVNIIYMCRPRVDYMKNIAEQVHIHTKGMAKKRERRKKKI